MSAVKHELDRRHDLAAIALDVAKRARAVKECWRHSDIAINQYNADANSRAHAIGTNSHKAGTVDGELKEFLAAISKAIKDSSDRCPHCETDMARDDRRCQI